MDPLELEGPYSVVAGVLFVALISYLLIEALVLHFRRHKLRLREARMALLGFLSSIGSSALVVRLWMPFGVGVLAVLGAAASPLDSLGLSWQGWIVGWLVYEFWYWVQHWAAHKVRLLWCIHSPHHAPRSMHILVGTNHHFVEGAFYLPFFAGFMPALCGVDPLVCVAINVVDALWGSLLHVSDEILPKGRYGALGRFLQTPSHHRVHHAKNVRYLDTNYNSITLLWDWVFGTLQPLRDEEPVEFGITREVDTGSFWDVHFGEFGLLAADVRGAPRWGDKLRYLFKPPGWKPGDDSQTAASRKRAVAEPLTAEFAG